MYFSYSAQNYLNYIMKTNIQFAEHVTYEKPFNGPYSSFQFEIMKIAILFYVTSQYNVDYKKFHLHKKM